METGGPFYHAPTYNLGGPHLRSYANNMLDYAAVLKYFIYLGTDGDYPLPDTEIEHDWDKGALVTIADLPIKARPEFKQPPVPWRAWTAVDRPERMPTPTIPWCGISSSTARATSPSARSPARTSGNKSATSWPIGATPDRRRSTCRSAIASTSRMNRSPVSPARSCISSATRSRMPRWWPSSPPPPCPARASPRSSSTVARP